MHLGYIELEKVCISLIWLNKFKRHYQIFYSISEICTAPLLSYFSKSAEILRLFVNTLTADKKYSRCNVHKFGQQVQTPLSKK